MAVAADLPPDGRLWHTNYAQNHADGTHIASAQQPPRTISRLRGARPWPDGSQFVTAQALTSERRTLLEVHDTASGKRLQQLRFKGYLRGLRPSPVDKTLLLASWSEDSLAPAHTVFLDLAKSEVVGSQPVTAGTIAWLPNGDFLRVAPDGGLTRGRVSGELRSAGQLNLPPGYKPGAVSVHPQGTQMALRLMSFNSRGTMAESDIWVANLDGSGLARVTRTKMSSYAHWSPDGRHLAFDVDTGTTCAGGHCMGGCGLWVVPASARDVRALHSVADAMKLRVQNSQGAAQTLGCELLAWTR